MRKPLILLALLLAASTTIFFYSHLTAFQTNSNPKPNTPATRQLTPWEAKIDEAERLRVQNPNDARPFYLAIDAAQNLLMQFGKEREALLLYARKAHQYGLQLDFDDRYAQVQDSICSVLEAKSKEWNDPDLLLTKEFILLDAFVSDGDLTAGEASYQKIERMATPEQWSLLSSARVVYGNAVLKSWEIEKADSFLNVTQALLDSHAKEIAQEEQPLHQQHFFHYRLFRLYATIGERYRDKQNYEQALHYYHKSIDQLHQQPYLDSLWLSTVYHFIANTYSFKGDLEKVREYYEKAISMVVQRHPHAFADYYHHVGVSHLEQNNAELALPFLLKSHQYNALVNDDARLKPYRFLHTWLALVQTYTDLDLQSDAAHWMRRMDSLSALHPAEKAADYAGDQAYSIPFARGYYYQHFNQYPEAKEQYQLAIQRYKALGNTIYREAYFQWGKMELEQGAPEKALPLFQTALYSTTHETATSDLANPTLDQIVFKHEALKYSIQKLETLRLLLASDKTADKAAYQKSSRELADLGIALLESVVNSFEREGSSKSLIETAYQLYDWAIEVYLELYQQEKKADYLNKAFELAERSKSILLMGALREENAMQFSGIPDSLIDKEHILNNNIAFYEQRVHMAQLSKNTELEKQHRGYLFEMKKALDELKKQLEKEYPQYFQLKYQQKFSTVAELQQKLGNEDLLIEYFEGKNSLYLFSISKQEGLNVQIISLPRDYKQQIHSFQRNLSDFNWIKEHLEESKQQFVSLSSDFFQKYVQPVWKKAPKRLIVVPDGLLNYIPFEILLSQATTTDVPYSEMPYLIKETAVNYHYSATLWATPSATRQKAAHSLLALAAHYPPADQQPADALRSPSSLLRKTLAPLEGARQEVEKLEAHWAGTFRYENQANETVFKQEADQYNILHLAMHGLVNAKHPDYSSLAFTDDRDSTNDDFLHANEIKRMRLNAELVVLSACETGYGKYQRGEGVVSLGRSFLYAGAASMVMSLWAVNDASTAQIMETFYEELHQGKSKSEALRQAKLSYLAQSNGISAHPAYWTPFVLLGSDAAVELPKSSGGWYGWALGAVAALGLGWMLLRMKAAR